jgi:MarR family transcriptional regulator, negative regulator of the multidrug operon emrRAB
MNDKRTLNLLGALSLSVMDVLEANTGYAGETSAALVSLGAEPGLSINSLSQILNLSHPGTVRLVDRLEKEKLLERKPGADGRTLSLFLTNEGVKRRKKILSERRQQLQPALGALSPSERKQLSRLLEKMLAAMTTNEQKWSTICRLCEEEVCPGKTCPVEQQFILLRQT